MVKFFPFSFWLVFRILPKDSSTRGIQSENSNWGVISLCTGQSAAPVMMIYCHSIEITPKFKVIQKYICHSCQHSCNISSSILPCLAGLNSHNRDAMRIHLLPVRCIKACILILPHWCCINTEHWNATKILPCSSAAKSSYNDSHNNKVGNFATHTGK